MAITNIANGTVYDSEDIANFLSAAFPELTDLKIRYLNKRSWSGRTVEWITPGYFLGPKVEVAILRPSKIPSNALEALATAATGAATVAAGVVVQDLVEVVRSQLDSYLYYSRHEDTQDRIDALEAPTIRVHEKAKGRKAATLANLREKINSRKESLANRKHKIDQARAEVEYQLSATEDDEQKLAEYEQKLAEYLAKAAKPTKKKAKAS